MCSLHGSGKERMAAREMISQLTKDEWDAINILGKAFLECQDPEEYEARMLLVGAIRYCALSMEAEKRGWRPGK